MDAAQNRPTLVKNLLVAAKGFETMVELQLPDGQKL